MTSLAVANSDAISFRVCDVWGGGSLPLRVYVLARMLRAARIRRYPLEMQTIADTPKNIIFLGSVKFPLAPDTGLPLLYLDYRLLILCRLAKIARNTA